MSWWRSRTAPVAPTLAAAVSPRIVPLRPLHFADQLTLHGLKLGEFTADRHEDPTPAAAGGSAEGGGGGPTNPLPLAAAGGSASPRHPLPLAVVDRSGLPTVPADVQEEVAELTGRALQAPQPLQPAPPASDASLLVPGGGAAPPIPCPEPRLPVSSRAQALHTGGGMAAGGGQRAAAVISSVEGGEVTVLQGARLTRSAVYRVALLRLAALSPPGHYRGALGAARRSRLWWRVNGYFIGGCIGGLVLGVGLLALCVFCPLAGIIVVVNVLVISGAVGAAGTRA